MRLSVVLKRVYWWQGLLVLVLVLLMRLGHSIEVCVNYLRHDPELGLDCGVWENVENQQHNSSASATFCLLAKRSSHGTLSHITPPRAP